MSHPVAVETAIETAVALPGWMERDELAQLAAWAGGQLRVAEVGVYAGRSTLVMAAALPVGGRLYAVDDFRGEPDRPELTGAALQAAFRQHCAGPIRTGQVVLLAMPSLAAAALLSELPALDLVFIDASHDYHSVRADLLAWLPLLRPGGRLTGHDQWQPPVKQALDDVLGSGVWQSVSNHLWAYDVPERAARAVGGGSER